MLVKFSPEGKVLMTIGRREDPVDMLSNMPGGGAFHGRNEKYRFGRQTDVAWDQQGNIFVSDGYFDARVVKFDKNGRFIKAVGTRGQRQPAVQHAALDRHRLPGQRLRRRPRQRARAGARQRSELEGELHRTSAIRGRCACRAARARRIPGKQYLYVSNSWPDSAPAAAAEFTGEVYKMELDGTIIGKFGRAGKAAGEFATIHQMDCRDPEHDLHRRNQRLALAEDSAEAAGHEDQRAGHRRRAMTRNTQGSVAAAVARRSARSLVAQTRHPRSPSTPTPTC